MLNNQLLELNEIQRYNLLISLALNIQTRANNFETYTPTDAFIDLRTYYFIPPDEQVYQILQSLENLSKIELLNLLTDLSNQLKASLLKEAFSKTTPVPACLGESLGKKFAVVNPNRGEFI